MASKNKKKQSYNSYIIIALVLVLAFVGYKFMAPQNSGVSGSSEGNTNIVAGTLDGKDLKLKKSDITEKASFYSYKEAGAYMEVLAIKAKDGTIRTALNTCQVCYDSGKGYYEQQGNTVICQNCGNVFGVDDIEVVKGGCNPVPILKENKTEDDEYITISGEFLAENKGLFERWKR